MTTGSGSRSRLRLVLLSQPRRGDCSFFRSAAGTATTIIDTLPALMNSIKMIHTIARYYNTNERMTNLFAKITDQVGLHDHRRRLTSYHCHCCLEPCTRD